MNHTANDVHMVAHAARMATVMNDRPDHPRIAEGDASYNAKFEEYRARWGKLDDESQTEIPNIIKTATRKDENNTELRVYSGIPVEAVDAAVALLENPPVEG